MNTIIDYNSVSVAEIAIEHPSAVSIFNKYHVDFCCGGKLPLQKACEKVGVNPNVVMEELLSAEEKSIPGTIRFDSWDTALLSDFIVQHHHQYVKRNIPQLKELIEKVCEAHGETIMELASLKNSFEALSQELLQHMEKEELILFPGIKRLFGEKKIPVDNTPIPMNLQSPMKVMEDEHTHAGDLIKKIRSLTNNYTPPPSACPTFKVTYKRLQEFDQDLMQHIHLENNVLFTKVKERLSEVIL